MKIAKTLILLTVVLRSILSSQESKFVEVHLPAGISIDVPRNWWLIGGDLNQVIETSAQAMLDLTGIKVMGKTTLLRATSMPRTTYAYVNINLYENADATPSEIKTISHRKLKLMDDDLRDNTEKILKTGDDEVLNWHGTRKDVIDGNPALVTEYRRSDRNWGPVVVQMNSIYNKDKLIRLTFSYRESEKRIWKPVIERMRISFKIES